MVMPLPGAARPPTWLPTPSEHASLPLAGLSLGLPWPRGVLAHVRVLAPVAPP